MYGKPTYVSVCICIKCEISHITYEKFCAQQSKFANNIYPSGKGECRKKSITITVDPFVDTGTNNSR